jgi:hypothetical protein
MLAHSRPGPGSTQTIPQSSPPTAQQPPHTPTHQAQVEAVINDDVSREVCGIDANGFQEDSAAHVAGSGVALQLQQWQGRQQA